MKSSRGGKAFHTKRPCALASSMKAALKFNYSHEGHGLRSGRPFNPRTSTLDGSAESLTMIRKGWHKQRVCAGRRRSAKGLGFYKVLVGCFFTLLTLTLVESRFRRATPRTLPVHNGSSSSTRHIDNLGMIHIALSKMESRAKRQMH